MQQTPLPLTPEVPHGNRVLRDAHPLVSPDRAIPVIVRGREELLVGSRDRVQALMGAVEGARAQLAALTALLEYEIRQVGGDGE